MEISAKHLAETEAWATKVASGKIEAGYLQRLSCEHFLGLLQSTSVQKDSRRLKAAFQFFDSILPLQPWQALILISLLGFQEDDARLYRRGFISVPRKNGKSTLAAAITLFCLLNDPRLKILLAAPSREQARLLIEAMKYLIGRNALINQILTTQKNRAFVEGYPGEIRVISGVDKYVYGYTPDLVVIDELHAYRDRGQFDALETALVATEEPLLLILSTAGDDQSRLYSWALEYSISALESNTDPSWFSFVARADEEDDWTSPDTWAKANPALGTIINVKELEGICRRAIGSPAGELAFRRYHLNQLAPSASQWVALELWNRTEGARPEGQPIAVKVGIDLSSSADLSAIVVAYKYEHCTYVELMAWACEGGLARSFLQRQLRRCRELRICPGDTIDYGDIKQTLLRLEGLYKPFFVFDRFGAHMMIADLIDVGVEPSRIIEFPQSARYFDPLIKKVRSMISAGELVHAKSELWDLALSGAAVRVDHRGLLSIRRARADYPIDPIVALLMAAGWEPATTQRGGAEPWVGIISLS